MQAGSARRPAAALVLAASMSGPIAAHAIDAREQALADIEVLIRHNGHLVETHTSKGGPLLVLTPTGDERMTLRFERSRLGVTGCRGFSEDFFLIEGRIVHWTPEPASPISRPLRDRGCIQIRDDRAVIPKRRETQGRCK